MLIGENIGELKTEDTVLVMPAVSVGNVGQLAVDLLIQNLNLNYYCRVNGHDCVRPVAGDDPFGSGTLCTSFMAYRNEKVGLLVFQQRSDFLRERKKEYLERLTAWLKQSKFQAIFLLTSAFSCYRDDTQMKLHPLQYRTTPAADEYLSSHKIAEESGGARRVMWDLRDREGDNKNMELPGSGIAQSLHANCQSADLPLIVVSKYCMEGDNRMDGGHVAMACASMLGLSELPRQWRTPISWKALYS